MQILFDADRKCIISYTPNFWISKFGIIWQRSIIQNEVKLISTVHDNWFASLKSSQQGNMKPWTFISSKCCQQGSIYIKQLDQFSVLVLVVPSQLIFFINNIPIPLSGCSWQTFSICSKLNHSSTYFSLFSYTINTTTGWLWSLQSYCPHCLVKLHHFF